MKLVFATNNLQKLEEIRQLTKNKFRILSLEDIGCNESIPETGNTLQANAILKARYVAEKFRTDCFADDTGLEIKSLNGKPGVQSARYAGAEQDSEKNILKVLDKLQNIHQRDALFKTIICLIFNNKEYLFSGEIKGKILHEKRGTGGFGYDSIFLPDGYEKTFAEMTVEEKNKISHRSIAVKKLIAFLEKLKT